MVNIRSAAFDDADNIWRILEPVLRAGESLAILINYFGSRCGREIPNFCIL